MSNHTKITEIGRNLGEPEWLLSWRESRLKAAVDLPTTLKYGIGITGVTLATETSFDQTAEYHVDASKGLELYTWKEAVRQEEIVPIVRALLESEYFPKASDRFGALAQALFRSGLVVYVQPNVRDDGTTGEERLILDTMIPAGTSADTILVVVKEGARLLFTSALSGGGEGSSFARTIVILTEADAHVRFLEKGSASKGAVIVRTLRGVVAAHSSVVSRALFTGETDMRSETEHLLVGESARGEIVDGVIAEKGAKYDIRASIKHKADHTHSRIRAAGVALDTSKTIYRGMIDMEKGVRSTDGGQEARFLVLSPTAEVDALPYLDIASKDVSCTHKVSISRIREGDIFYPKLRGLSDEESRQLFLEGHFAQVFSGDENEEIMNDIRKHL